MAWPFSIECMARDLKSLGEWGSQLGEARVFVPDISGRAFEEQLGAVRLLVDSGIGAIPHLGARNISSRAELARKAESLASAGVTEVLLLGGESDPPAGEYDSSWQLLDSDAIREWPLERIGIAGHPEPHPSVSAEEMFAALVGKSGAISEQGREGFIVTQLCFDAPAVCEWISRVREAGVRFPIHVGIAGPISLAKLVKFAGTLGVGKSLGYLKKSGKSMRQMLDPTYDPSALMADVRRTLASSGDAVSFHFYAFGNVSGSLALASDSAAMPVGGRGAGR